MNKAYLLTGGNVGDRMGYLQQAIALLNQHCGKVTRLSAVYETAAWGKTDQSAFLNQALELQTPLTATHLMPQLLLLEEKMGRRRMEKYGPRIIDIDILLFNNEVHHSAELMVPHPELPNRLFALQPLHDIAPLKKHPLLHKTIRRLLKECTDVLNVKKI